MPGNMIPASLVISPPEARRRFQDASQGLVDTFGADRVSYHLGTLTGESFDPQTIRNWAKGRTVAQYHIAIALIAWYDREINSGVSQAKEIAQV